MFTIFASPAHRHLAVDDHAQSLEGEATGALSEKPFIELLEEGLEAEKAKRALEIAIEWGRYGEVYEYDFHTGLLKLPDQAEE